MRCANTKRTGDTRKLNLIVAIAFVFIHFTVVHGDGKGAEKSKQMRVVDTRKYAHSEMKAISVVFFSFKQSISLRYLSWPRKKK